MRSIRSGVPALIAGAVLFALSAQAANAAFSDTDSGFGSNATPGYVTVDLGSTQDYGAGIATAQDGSFYALGVNPVDQAAGKSVTIVMHFSADGKLDTSFGTGGKMPLLFDTGEAVALNKAATGFWHQQIGTGTLLDVDTAHGFFYIGGINCPSVQTNGTSVITCRPQVVRFRMDGTIDPSYGNKGYSDFIPTPGPNNKDFQAEISSMRLGPDGKMYLFGLDSAFNSSSPGNFVARLTKAGKLDATFNASGASPGYLGFNLGPCLYAKPGNMAFASNGSLYLASTASSGSSCQNVTLVAAVVRVLPNGTLDPAFGSNGVATASTLTGASFGDFVREQANGEIAFLYFHWENNGQTPMHIVVLKSDGTRDTAVPVTDLQNPTFDQRFFFSRFFGLKFTASGKLLMSGMFAVKGSFTQTTTPEFDMAIRRNMGDPRFAVSPPNLGPADTLPNAFSFVNVTDATPGALVKSNIVTPVGYDGPAMVRVIGGSFSVNGGPFTTVSRPIYPGETLQLATTAPSAGQTATATVNVGGAGADFSVSVPGNSTGGGGCSLSTGGKDGGLGIEYALLLAAAAFVSLRKKFLTVRA